MRPTPTPFELYRRKRIFDLLLSEDFEVREVLEVGIKSGDNLRKILNKKPKAVFGLASSNKHVTYLKKNLEGLDIDLSSIRGKFLPFPRQAFDLVFTESFLQTVTDQKKYDVLFREICRASDNILILIESTEEEQVKEEGYIGRKLKHYVDFCKKNQYDLLRVEYINIEISEQFCRFLASILDLSSPAYSIIQKLVLPITAILDSFFPANRNTTKMVFQRQHDDFY